MPINCEQYLAALPNRQCMEEFLKVIPKQVQQAISASIDIIKTASTVQKVLDTYLYSQYLVALAALQYQINVLKAQYAPFFETLDLLQTYVKRYRN